MVILQKILGFEPSLFALLVVIFFILINIIFFLYFSVVFVSRDCVKIVERFKKETIVLKTGIWFILPIRDKVVANISLSEKTYSSKNALLLNKTNSKEDLCVFYSLSFLVNDPLKFYYSCSQFSNLIETKIGKCLVLRFRKQQGLDLEDIDKLIDDKLLDCINCECSSLGIEIKDLFFNSAKKQ